MPRARWSSSRCGGGTSPRSTSSRPPCSRSRGAARCCCPSSRTRPGPGGTSWPETSGDCSGTPGCGPCRRTPTSRRSRWQRARRAEEPAARCSMPCWPRPRAAAARQVLLEVRRDNARRDRALRLARLRADRGAARLLRHRAGRGADAPPTPRPGGASGMSVDEPLVLGIETSCDETGVGLVRGTTLLADAVASSVDEHARFGGVVPEVASRAHLEAMVPTIERACADAGVRLADVDAVAVTGGPGPGRRAAGRGGRGQGARAVAGQAALRRQPPRRPRRRRPARARTAARAVRWRCWSPAGTPRCCWCPTSPRDVAPLGATIDDAAGEAFDKVARLLGLPFPGGPWIDREAARRGDATFVRFPRGLTSGRDMEQHRYDFSFSGLKTAVARWVEAREAAGEPVPVRRRGGVLPGGRGRRAHPQGGAGVPGARRRPPRRRRRGRRQLPAARAGPGALRRRPG